MVVVRRKVSILRIANLPVLAESPLGFVWLPGGERPGYEIQTREFPEHTGSPTFHGGRSTSWDGYLVVEGRGTEENQKKATPKRNRSRRWRGTSSDRARETRRGNFSGVSRHGSSTSGKSRVRAGLPRRQGRPNVEPDFPGEHLRVVSRPWENAGIPGGIQATK